VIGTGLFKVTLCSIIGDGSARANDTPKTPFRVSSDRAARERTSIHSQPSLAKENGGYVPFRRRDFLAPACLRSPDRLPDHGPWYPTCSCQPEEVLDEGSPRRLRTTPLLRRRSGTETFLAELCPRGDGPERRVEVVRDGVREVLQLRLGATISQ